MGVILTTEVEGGNMGWYLILALGGRSQRGRGIVGMEGQKSRGGGVGVGVGIGRGIGIAIKIGRTGTGTGIGIGDIGMIEMIGIDVIKTVSVSVSAEGAIGIEKENETGIEIGRGTKHWVLGLSGT